MAHGSGSQRKMPNGWAMLSWLLAAALLLSGCAGTQTNKVYRVGILSGLNYIGDTADGFRARMSELGYVEGENITYDIQRTDFDMAVYQSIAEKFVADEVDLILVFPTEASIVAKTVAEGSGVPVLFTYAIIEDMGLVESLRSPGGNITGVRYPSGDIALKRLEMLLDIAPQVKRIYMPYQRGYPIVPGQLEVLHPAAEAAGVTLIEAPADNAAELQSLLDAQPAEGGFDAILMLVEPLLVGPDAYLVIASYAYEHDIPIGGTYVVAGDLKTIFSVGVNSYDAGTLAAPLADKILQGTQAGSIPVASSEPYIEIDISTAQHFGLIVPEGLLRQANRIIR